MDDCISAISDKRERDGTIARSNPAKTMKTQDSGAHALELHLGSWESVSEYVYCVSG